MHVSSHSLLKKFSIVLNWGTRLETSFKIDRPGIAWGGGGGGLTVFRFHIPSTPGGSEVLWSLYVSLAISVWLSWLPSWQNDTIKFWILNWNKSSRDLCCIDENVQPREFTRPLPMFTSLMQGSKNRPPSGHLRLKNPVWRVKKSF